MYPQHLAARHSIQAGFEALASQACALGFSKYLFHRLSLTLSTGYRSVSGTSFEGQVARKCVKNKVRNRRLRCPRASNCWQPSALLLSLQPVRVSSRSKSLWLSIRNPFRPNPRILVNTSKQFRGQAYAPVLVSLAGTQRGAPC